MTPHQFIFVALAYGAGIVNAVNATVDAAVTLGGSVEGQGGSVSGALSGGVTFTSSSTCDVKYTELPYMVDCTFGVAIPVDSSFNNGQDLVFEFHVSAALNTINSSDTVEMLVGYGFKTPEINFGITSGLGGATGKINSFEFGMKTTASFSLSGSKLSEGVCLSSSLVAYAQVEGNVQERTAAAAVAAAAKFTGSDICFKVTDLIVDFENTGASAKLLVQINFLNSTKASAALQATIGDISLDITGSATGYSKTINIGLSVYASVQASNRRMLAGDYYVDDEGQFRFGSKTDDPNASNTLHANMLMVSFVLAAFSTLKAI